MVTRRQHEGGVPGLGQPRHHLEHEAGQIPESSSAVGSSAKTQRGLPMTAAAKASRCCSPPESCVGRLPALPPGRCARAGRRSGRHPDRGTGTASSRCLACREVIEQVVARLLEDEGQIEALESPEPPPGQRAEPGWAEVDVAPVGTLHAGEDPKQGGLCPSPKGRRAW